MLAFGTEAIILIAISVQGSVVEDCETCSNSL